ncbi:MAG TPA: PQQ-dependent sugar dehydrogenase [Polyangiaceae bacterium]|nr:PQQ-dependent sugar dehydrogenase [Polyangiaceae bacterium]
MLGASTTLGVALGVSCGDEPSPPATGVPGKLQLGLTAELDGVVYRLDAVFDVTGVESAVLDSSDDPDASVLTRELAAGAYVVALRPGFVVSRNEGGEFVPVEATLLSELEQSATISANTTTRVTYRFGVDGGQIDFGTGTLEITFEVVDAGADCRPAEGAAPPLALELVADGLDQPVLVTAAPGDTSRLFVLEKAGTIRVVRDGVLSPEPFLDLTSQVASQGERGLLGLAFHPDYEQNGLFYVFFSSNGSGAVPLGTNVVAELAAVVGDPDHADPLAQRQLLTIAKPESNHNGGMIAFGADGFLYLGIGDGGGGNDQHGPIGNGQALDTLLGKMLRIDVDARDAGEYGVPPANLAEATGLVALPEIWASGLRNPWRFGFDPCNGDLYIGDVGQSTLEEIDYLAGGTPAGTNFGWRIMEGNVCRPGEVACDTTGLTLPVDIYPRDVGASVTGGNVYRGSAIPGLRGYYLYADYVSGRSFRFRIEAGAVVDRQDISAELRPPASEAFGNIAGFGQDNAGDVYVAAFTPGAIYRVVAAP